MSKSPMKTIDALIHRLSEMFKSKSERQRDDSHWHPMYKSDRERNESAAALQQLDTSRYQQMTYHDALLFAETLEKRINSMVKEDIADAASDLNHTAKEAKASAEFAERKLEEAKTLIEDRINGEQFIDDIVTRIRSKQLKIGE